MKKVGGVRVSVRVQPQRVLRQHCYDLLAAQREAHARIRRAVLSPWTVVLAEVREHPVAGATPLPHFTVFDGDVWVWCGRGSTMTMAIETYETLGRDPA